MGEKEIMVTVPYGDFVDGIQALADLNSIRAMLVNGKEYCSDAILAVLEMEKRNAGANREQNAD